MPNRLAGVEEGLRTPFGDRHLLKSASSSITSVTCHRVPERPAYRPGRGLARDAPAGRRRAGEGDHVDVGVLGDRLARNGADARDEIEHARRKADLVNDLGEYEGVTGATSDGLRTNGATGSHRVGGLGAIWFNGKFHGVIGADDSDRLTYDQRAVLFRSDG